VPVAVPEVPGDTIRLPCPECRTERAFAQPPCADGHGPECPEWFCTACGAAVVVGFEPEVSEPVTRQVRAA